MTSAKSTASDPMKYLRWHIRLILEPYGKTCYATKKEAQKEADEIVSRKPALRGVCQPVETRCAISPIGPDCIAKMPKELAERFKPKRCSCQCGCEECDSRPVYRFRREPRFRDTVEKSLPRVLMT